MARKRKRKASRPRRRRARRSVVVTRTVRMSNPRRRRNPGVGGLFVTSLTGLSAGALAGFVTTKMLGNQSAGLRALGTLVLAGIEAFALKSRPNLADAAAGATLGSLGYAFGVNAGGGLVATNKADAVAGVAKMPTPTTTPATTTPSQSGMGLLINNRAARSLTGMGTLVPMNPRGMNGMGANGMGASRMNINPRVLLG